MKFAGVTTLIKKFMYPVGFCLLEPLRLNRQSFSLLILMAIGSVYCGSAIAVEWPDYEKMLQITMTMSILIQTLTRFFCYIYDQKTCLKLHEVIVKFYEDCNELDEKTRKVSTINFQHLRTSFKIIFLIHVFCEFLPFIISLYDFAFNGKTIPPVPAFIPFLDRDSSISFFVNFIYQLFMAVMFTFFNPEVDWIYTLIISQTKAHVDVIESKLEKISVLIEDETAKRSDESKKMLKKSFVELVKNHRRMLDYFNLASRFISKQFFVLISVNIYVICSSGISLLTSGYSSAIGIVILYPIHIFYVCILGEFVKHQHKRLNALLWDFKWYNLPLSHQKDFLLFMLNAQQPLRLEMLFIGVIDLEFYISVSTSPVFLRNKKNFLQVINLVYSYFMVMWKFIHV